MTFDDVKKNMSKEVEIDSTRKDDSELKKEIHALLNRIFSDRPNHGRLTV